jgi:hypothetical protein
MRYNALVNSFVDLAMQSWLYNPHIVIRAAEVATAFGQDGTIIDGDDWWRTMPVRPVIYEDADANKYYHELVPYVHPTGADDLVLGTIAYAANGQATYTPSFQGRLLAEAGTLVPIAAGPQDAIDVAGMLFSDYYYHFTDNLTNMEHYRCHTISEGDFLWIVRRGEVYLDAASAVTSGEILNTDVTTAGEVLPATAIDVLGTIGEYHATLEDHLWGPNFHAVAEARETIEEAGEVLSWLDLPKRFSR